MRNQEAARYARWAAITAGVIAIAVAGVYAKRAIQTARARHSVPAVVPATVQQQSAEFKFTKMEQDRALFTIRASQATRFKDQDRSLLEDVWITIYGRAGDRNDNIHTRECSYEPTSGQVRCEGDVEIDIQGANPASGKPADKELEVKTSNLSFNRDTGEASTPEKVEFQSPQGHGHAVGVSYSTQTSVIRLDHDVSIEAVPAGGIVSGPRNGKANAASDRLGGMPLTATGSSLEIRRNDRRVVLNGPAVMKQGARELSAGHDFDRPRFHVSCAARDGRRHPIVRSLEGGGKMEVAAEKIRRLSERNGLARAHCRRWKRARKPRVTFRQVRQKRWFRSFCGGARGIRDAACKKSRAGDEGQRRRRAGFGAGWRIAFAEDGGAPREVRRGLTARSAENRKRRDAGSRDNPHREPAMNRPNSARRNLSHNSARRAPRKTVRPFGRRGSPGDWQRCAADEFVGGTCGHVRSQR